VFDTIIKSGQVFDGAGSPWFRADIGICGGKIVEIGRVRGEANRVIDASKLFVCPGFIDTHTHSDVMVFVNPQADNVVLQGVTTQMMGNCGMSAAPLRGKTMHPEGFIFVKQVQEYGITVDWRSFSEYLSKIERQGTAVNLASLVGHGTVRQAVVGNSARALTPDELEEIKRLIAESMEAGAYGLSVGLEYVPGKWASTEELIECAKIVAQYNGIYASHSRNRDAKAHLAVAEAIHIGEKARVPVLISHLTERFPAPDGGVRRGLAVM